MPINNLKVIPKGHKTRKKVVLKKGKYVATRKGDFVIKLSKKIYDLLNPLSKKIMLAGSIRRGDLKPVDVDIVLIPKDKDKILEAMAKKGKFMQGGEKRSEFKVEGVKVELYYTETTSWGASILSYTGPKGSSIGLRIIARNKGWLLNQYGLFDKNGKMTAGKTEKEIYEALEKKYKVPRLR